jgi:hypothetical protein
MPYIVRPRGLRRIAAAALGSALLACAAPGAASAACASSSTSTPFAQFGDHADYSLLAGGSFESGATGWSLTRAKLISGNESYNAVSGSHSLEIAPGGAATSPAFCVNIEEPTFRLFVRRTGGAVATGTVVLRWTDSLGVTHDTPVGIDHPGASWAPTPLVGLSVALPLGQALQTVTARLVFLAGPEGAVAIDDVFIDPYRR